MRHNTSSQQHCNDHKQSTVIGLLSDNLNSEYLTALASAPDLVKKETPMTNFLRRENHDPAKASYRLAAYWKYRKSLFGDRWLRPMIQ